MIRSDLTARERCFSTISMLKRRLVRTAPGRRLACIALALAPQDRIGREDEASPSIPRDLLEAVRERRCILYAGAGFSLEATLPGGDRLPTGNELAYILAGELHDAGSYPELDENRRYDLAETADDYVTRFGRNRLERLLMDTFGRDGLRPSEAHRIAIHLFPRIITTNYDLLFERAAGELARTPLVVRYDSQIPLSGDRTRPIIMKIHGDLENLDGVVITSDDYLQKQPSAPILYTLYLAFAESLVLMVGCDLEDTDFRFVYLKVLDKFGDRKPRAFLVSPSPDSNSPDFGRWELKRMKWDGRATEHIDDTAGSFLALLNCSLGEGPDRS